MPTKTEEKTVRVTGGVIRCPECGKTLMRNVLPDTKAEKLPLYCKHCKREWKVNIDASLSLFEPEPS